MKTPALRLVLSVLLCVGLYHTHAQNIPITLSAYEDISAVSSCATIDSASMTYHLDTLCAASLYIPHIRLQGIDTIVLHYVHVDSAFIFNVVTLSWLPTNLRGLWAPGAKIRCPLPDSLRMLTSIDFVPAVLPPYLEYWDCSRAYGSLAMNTISLPATLKSLICTYNYGPLPTLPAGLEYLDCSHNGYMTLPATLPTALKYLDCSYDPLNISLPALPAGLKTLNCEYIDSLRTLSGLPASLDTLYCSADNLYSLSIPPGLVYLVCASNPQLVLPSPLPPTLSGLVCSYTHTTTLPPLPASLTLLSSEYCQLTDTPALPAGLQTLGLSGTGLRVLPTLPAGLKTLSYSNNKIYSLPAQLPAGLQYLFCDGDSLSQLPPLPATLLMLICSNNQIAHLPVLPAGLTKLWCTGDRQLLDMVNIDNAMRDLRLTGDSLLSCLPTCPSEDQLNLEITGTAIRCLPRYFSSLYRLPLCAPASGCPFAYNIEGQIHLDTAASCTADSLAPGHPMSLVKVMLKKNGQIVQQMYSTQYGQYSFDVDTLRGYDVAVDSSTYLLVPACPSTGQRSVLLTAADSVRFDQDFGMRCAGADYRPMSIGGRFRPGSQRTMHLTAGNIAQLWYGAGCGGSMPGTVTTILNGAVSYASPAAGALTPSAVSGRVLTYNIADLSAIGSLDILVNVDSSATIDSSVCATLIIKSATPDADIHDDTLTICTPVVNSFDPNHKEVYPTAASPDGDWLTYTIHFQNTGNDTAYTVVLRDTLSSYVIPESFEYMASSHPAVVQLNGKAMTFTFAKINLVDSATNPPLSEGWIQYRVRSKPNLPLQTQIPNTAYIFFDLNAPIVTNTAMTTVDTVLYDPSGIRAIAQSTNTSLYPNPNTGLFTLQCAGAQVGEYTITDMLGHIVQQRSVTTTLQAIDMREAAPGIYTIAVRGAGPLRFTIVK